MYLTCMTCCNNHFSSLSHHLPLKQPPLNSSPQVRCRVVCGSIEQSLAPLPSGPLKGPGFNKAYELLKSHSRLQQLWNPTSILEIRVGSKFVRATALKEQNTRRGRTGRHSRSRLGPYSDDLGLGGRRTDAGKLPYLDRVPLR